MTPASPSLAIADWLTVLDQISTAISDAAAAIVDPTDEAEWSASNPAESLRAIDEQLTGFDERLAAVRALARQIEGALADDESTITAFQKTAAEARLRPVPAGRL